MQTYRIGESVGLLKRNFGQDCVIYLSSARETHLLSVAAAQVLSLIEKNARSLNALVEAMNLYFEDAAEFEVSILVDEVVAGLSRIGIIETVEDAS